MFQLSVDYIKSLAKSKTTSGKSGSGTASPADTNDNSNSGPSTISINAYDGTKHTMIFEESGAVWDHNETSDTWSTREGEQILTFVSTSDDSVIDPTSLNASDVYVKNGSTISKYDLKAGSTIGNYTIDTGTKKTTDKDNNPNQYHVAVIDDFDTPIISEDSSDTSENTIAHGDIVRALISSDDPTAAETTTKTDSKSLNYNLGSAMSYTDILTYLKDIEQRVSKGEDIDAVNMSLGVSITFEELGLSGYKLADLDKPAVAQKVVDALKTTGYSQVVDIINQVSKMASEGMEFYISSGNDGDDTYYTYGDTTYYGTRNGTDVYYSATDTKTYGTKGNKNALYSSTDTDPTNYETYSAADTDGDGKITQDEWYTYNGGSAVDENGDGTITGKELYDYNKEYDVNNDGKITSGDFYNYYDGDKYDFDMDNELTGNDYYLYYSDKDTNYDGIVTGRELGVFNALTMSSSDNVHVIGATSSTGQSSSAISGIANYSDQNGAVDANYDGDVNLTYLGYDETTKKYLYDVDGDGIADLYSNTSDGYSYYINGTSFASPRAAKTNDKNLT